MRRPVKADVAGSIPAEGARKFWIFTKPVQYVCRQVMPDKEIDMKHVREIDGRCHAREVLPSCVRPVRFRPGRNVPKEQSVKSSVPAPMFDGCSWVFHDGSHCGEPIFGRYRDMCEVHGMLAI